MHTDNYQKTLLQAGRWLLNGIKTRLSRTVGESGSVYFRSLKALCEIAYLEYCVLRVPDSQLQALLASLLNDLMHTPAFLSLVRHNTEHANLFIPLLTSALSAGIEFEKSLEDDLLNLIRHSAGSTKEKLPFRHIDILHGFYRLTGQPDYLMKIEHHAQTGCLGTGSGLNTLSISDEYAITHTIFYMTDFGRLPWRNNIMHKNKLAIILQTLMDIAVEKNDDDILGEYVLCKQYLGLPQDEFIQDINLLITHQDTCGFWRGPTALATKLLEEGFIPEDIEFFEHYHTTIVVRAAIDQYLHQHTSVPDIPFRINLLTRTQGEGGIVFDADHLCRRAYRRNDSIVESALQLWCIGIVAFTPSLLASPSTILPAIELLFFHKRRGGIITDDFRDLLETIVKVNPLEHKENTSFVQIWLLSCYLIHNAISYTTDMAVFRELQVVYEYKHLPMGLLLRMADNTDDTIFTDYVIRETRKKLVQKQTLDVLTIIIYGIDYIKNDDILMLDIIDYIQSMNALWSCFGWLKDTDCSEAGILDFYALAAAGTLSAHGLTTVEWRNSTTMESIKKRGAEM